jgi:hypothetical protein
MIQADNHCGEIRYWLMKREVLLRESKGKVLNVCYSDDSHYSLPIA